MHLSVSPSTSPFTPNLCLSLCGPCLSVCLSPNSQPAPLLDVRHTGTNSYLKMIFFKKNHSLEFKFRGCQCQYNFFNIFFIITFVDNIQLKDLGVIELKLENWVPQITELQNSRCIFTFTWLHFNW